MSVKRITPDEAAKLMEQGWRYVDVRSVAEFDAGHPSGSYNVPFRHQTDGRFHPNPKFVSVMTSAFARDDNLIIGCRSGGRSLAAAELLVGEGFSEIVDMRGGVAGEVDRSGAVTCAGWQSRGLPMSTAATSGCSYEELERASE